MMTQLKTVAFDIETTGFQTTDQVTVIGFDADISSRVFLNVDNRGTPSSLQERLDDELNSSVVLSTHENEAALFEAMSDFVESSLRTQEIKLVAYNGETWKGGFDLPFVRTRLNAHDLEWPFLGLPYIDLMDVFESRFNTTETSLTAVYEELLGDDLGELDPFEDSSEAVEAWKGGNFEPVVRHNVADVRRTRALMDVAERYCSKSDFSMKSLDPVA